MKEKIKQITKKINDLKIFLIIIFIIGGIFYWYEWRPNQIIKKCANETKKSIGSKIYDNLYRNCLGKSGLKQ